MKSFTITEVARELGVSAGLVYSLCSSRRLRHERHGLGRGTIRIPEDALEEYRQAATVEVETSLPTSTSKPPPLKNLSLF